METGFTTVKLRLELCDPNHGADKILKVSYK